MENPWKTHGQRNCILIVEDVCYIFVQKQKKAVCSDKIGLPYGKRFLEFDYSTC